MNTKYAAILAVVVVVAAGVGAGVILLHHAPEEDKGWYSWNPTTLETKTAHFTLSPNLYNGAALIYKEVYGVEVDTNQYNLSQVPSDFMSYTSLIKATDDVKNTVTIESKIRGAKVNGVYAEPDRINVEVPVNPDYMICTGSYAVLLYELMKVRTPGVETSALWEKIYGLDKSAFNDGTASVKTNYGLDVPTTLVKINSTYSLNTNTNLAEYVTAFNKAKEEDKSLVTMMSGSLGVTYTQMTAKDMWYDEANAAEGHVFPLFFYSESISDVFAGIEALGAVYGLLDEAHSFIDNIRVNYYNLYMQAKAQPGPQKTVYFESKGGTTCCGTNNITSTVLEMLNLKNIVTGEGWVPVTEFGDENVVLNHPDVIIFYDNETRSWNERMRVPATTE